MAEDKRLKNENIDEPQHIQQSHQPQHPQQTIHTENLLEETLTVNNIDYIR